MSLAQQVLEIELEGTDTGKYVQIVDGLTRKVSKAIRKEKAPTKIIRAMNAVFFEDESFLAEEGTGEPPFLYQTLDSGRGGCYSLSLLYLVTADYLGLPIHPVLAPSHIFCRWSDGRNSINIEATHNGESLQNYWYIEDLKISKISLQKGVYLKNINRKNLEGVVIQRRSQLRYNNGLVEQAFEDAEKAVRLAPLLRSGHLVRARCHMEGDRYQEALSDLGRAISLDPNFSTAYLQRGEIHCILGNLNKAVVDFSDALKIEPTSVGFQGRAWAFGLSGKYELAINDLNKALSLDPDDLEAILARGGYYARIGEKDKALSDLSTPIDGQPDEAKLAEMKKEGYKVLGML